MHSPDRLLITYFQLCKPMSVGNRDTFPPRSERRDLWCEPRHCAVNEPSWADGDTPAAVVLVVWVSLIIAALLHKLIGLIFDSQVTSVS